jgi:hypothetical protein
MQNYNIYCITSKKAYEVKSNAYFHILFLSKNIYFPMVVR